MKKKISRIIAIVLAIMIVVSTPIVINASKDDKTQETTEVSVAAAAAKTTEITTEVTTVETTKPETTTKVVTTTKSKPTTTKVVTTTKKQTTEERHKSSEGYYGDVELQYNAPYYVTSNRLTASAGVVWYNGHKETWYSQRVLPGGGLRIPGRHVADDGTVRDGDGYICIAANYLSYGSTIMTSLGPGKVYDCGDMTGEWIDIYVNW